MKVFSQLLACLPGLLLVASMSAALERDTSLFVEPPGLEPDIQFWIRIYTEVEGNAGLLHDSRHIHIVYEEVEIPGGLSEAAKERIVEKKKDRIRRILRKLGRGERRDLNQDERGVLALFPSNVSSKELIRASKRLRFQLGQADKFRSGLIREGRYADHVRETLVAAGLPTQLAALPHVESSYTPEAYSRVGAAGLWQFTRATGRRFMRVDQVVDERRDPFTATAAAAKLLAQNLRATGSWPLAITAYNHGASGIRRAARKMGDRDIEKIVRNYRSRTFGFASRNFYVEFIAASRVAEDPEHYFGPLRVDSPVEYESLPLPFYAATASLSRVLGVDTNDLRAANPALLSPVWSGQKRVPREFIFKVERAHLDRPLAEALASLPDSERFARQTRDSFHIVRRGETLSRIAQKYRVPIRELADLNGLRNRNHIRVGQRLRLPIEHASGGAKGNGGEENTLARPADGLYTVRKGDSLNLIALRFGVDEAALAATNGIRNRHRIYAGRVLRIPGPGEALPGPMASSPLVTESKEPDAPRREAPSTGFADEARRADTEPGLEGPRLLADPSDYLVGANDSIEVQFGETLGHYAEWLDLRAQQLRLLNRLTFGEALPIHSRLQLDFSRVSKSLFEKQRIDFQRGLQTDYFAEREIVGTLTHKLERGDSIWILAHRRFHVPLWLLQQYNPDVDFETAPAGTEIIAPVLRRHGAPGAP